MNKKALLIIFILVATMAVTLGLPKPKYKSLNILNQIDIPKVCGTWSGEDDAQDERADDARYNFVSRVFSRTYEQTDGTNLVMLILDAGNFHNPKVCFTGAGFKVGDSPSHEFIVRGRKVKAYATSVERSGDHYLLFYWMCIDKKPVDWFEQKAKQFLASLINKKKAGLMVRIDVAVTKSNEEWAYAKIQDFLTALSANMNETDLDYVFGEK
jgi:EpsI family protein